MISENVKSSMTPINDFLIVFLKFLIVAIVIFFILNIIKKWREKRYFKKHSMTNSISTTNDWWSWDFMIMKENIQNAQENNSGSDLIIVQDAIDEGVINEAETSNIEEISN